MSMSTTQKNETGTVSLFVLIAIVAAFMSIEAKSASVTTGLPVTVNATVPKYLFDSFFEPPSKHGSVSKV